MSSDEKPELAQTVAEEHAGESRALPRGATLGRYLLLDELGAGGMGVVYEAYDPELDRRVALKLVRHLAGSAGDSSGRSRVLREAQGIARLAHPNVVAVHDVGTSGDTLFIAMELVVGETLAEWMKKPHTLRETLAMFIQAGRGLAAAHAAGLVHRDFKPDNVLVGRDGRARVVDFGLVREAGSTAPEAVTTVRPGRVRPSQPALSTPLTLAGVVVGTPFYMAPEQMRNETPDARSDQYSFCVSLYEALAGKVPFGGGSFEEVREKVLSGVISDLPAKLPVHVRLAVKSGLARDPAQRWPSMDALLAELARDPAGTRRRVMVTIGVLGAAAAAVAVPLALRDDQPAPCAGARMRVATAWGPMQRAAVEAAFVATRVPYAQTAFAAVSKPLDAYAEGWAHSYEESCQATHVRHEQSTELLDLRTACLQRRHTELAALVDLLLQATPRAVSKAHTAVAGLSPIADCDDLVALRSLQVLPADPATRLAISDARDELGQATALLHSGRFKDSIARAKSLLERARPLGYRPLVAEIALILGKVLSRSGDEVSARIALAEAFIAGLAGHHDDVAAQAALALVLTTTNGDEIARGEEWALVARGVVERLGDPPGRVAAYHAAIGHLYSSQGKHAEAAVEHEAARVIRERINDPMLPRTLTSIAYNLDEIGRFAEARRAAEVSLELQEQQLGPDHPEIATVLMNLGNVMADEGDLDAAARVYERARKIREVSAQNGDDPMLLASVLNNLGVIAFERGQYAESLKLQREAWAIRHEHAPNGAEEAMSYTNIGDTQRALGDYAQAYATYQTALAVAEAAVGADHPYVGDALIGIGKCRLHAGEVADAVAPLERALAIRKQGSRPVELADAEITLARALWSTDPARARLLATSARDAFATSKGSTKELAEAEAWLAAHR